MMRDENNIENQENQDSQENQGSQNAALNPLYIEGTASTIAGFLTGPRDLATFARLCKFTNGLQVVQKNLTKLKNERTLEIGLFEKSKFDIMKNKDTKPYASNEIHKFEMHIKTISQLLSSQASNPKFLLSILNELTSNDKLRNLPTSEKLDNLKAQADGLKVELARQVAELDNDNNNNGRSNGSKCNIV